MRGWSTEKIVKALQAKIDDFEKQGYQVKHLVYIIDNHSIAMFQGVGGLDGLKDIVICYHR